MIAWSEHTGFIPSVPAGGKAPQLKWWGNVFRRVWADRTQIVIVLRLPRYRISWRQGEGFRCGK